MSRRVGVDETTGLQVRAREVLQALFAAFQALRLYPLENDTVQQTLTELHNVTSRVLDREGDLDFRVAGDFFFLNEVRLRIDLSNYATFGTIAAALKRHGIGAVRIEHGVANTEWAPFLSLLLQRVGSGEPFAAFSQRLARTPVEHLGVRPRTVTVSDEEQREEAKRAYLQTVRVAKEVLTDVRLGKAVNVRKVKRAVQGIVDQVLTNRSSIVGMTTLKEFDEYTFTHSVNVCIFSVVIGQKMQLAKDELYELGLGALLHDIGKMQIDTAILNKPGALTDEEFQQMKRHPREGLLALFAMRGFAEIPYRQMLVAYEHHMKVDLSGYPTPKRSGTPALFSRIVAVADSFDAMTSSRSYRYEPFAADAVLKDMLEDPSRGMDTLVVKAFINVTGVYPVGTLVVLDTMEMGVVAQANPDSERLHQPLVLIISDSQGTTLVEPERIDLAEVDPVTGQPRRTIIKTADPQKYGINVGHYFL
ncbi:MAG: HD-GYP domain-containing protein [Gemmatimonadetes bacterium]|nr:HD-GYP domain-containing protein [Gemmatimonadota bacterium]